MKGVVSIMSKHNYKSDLLNTLELNNINGEFYPEPFKGTGSCIRMITNKKGVQIKQIRVTTPYKSACACPNCGSHNKHKYKGFLAHKSSGTIKNEIYVDRRRYQCIDCNRYFIDEVPFKVPNHRVTIPAL